MVRIPQTLANQPVKNLKLLVQKSVENRGIMFPMTPSGKKDVHGNEIGNDVTADIAIRKAINYAVDRNILASQLFEGQATPAFKQSRVYLGIMLKRSLKTAILSKLNSSLIRQAG